MSIEEILTGRGLDPGKAGMELWRAMGRAADADASEPSKCSECGRQVRPSETFSHLGMTLCPWCSLPRVFALLTTGHDIEGCSCPFCAGVRAVSEGMGWRPDPPTEGQLA